MGNTALEKNQAKEFTDVVAEYNFTCEWGDTKSDKSQKKTALKKGIRLHFLRYGMFYRESTRDLGHNNDGPTSGENYRRDEIEAAHNEIPDAQAFYLAKTALNQGYIYLMNDENPNDYYEYEVNEHGALSTITWEYNKGDDGKYLDVRKSENDHLHYKVISHGKKFWVAYSANQWSRDYHNKLNTNKELREKRMILVDCSGIKKGTEDVNSNIVPYSKLRTAHYRKHPYYQVHKNLTKEIHIDEAKQDEKGDNEVFEDMFIALDDPLGCANDIGGQLVSGYNKLDAIIESIQTGEDDESIFKRIEKGEERSSTPTDYEKQVSGLFSSALTTYQLIYNDEKMEDEYGDTTDKSKLLKILAVDERKQQRQRITTFRDDFGNFLSSEYYKKYFFDYTEGGIQELFEGKSILPLHLSLLAIHPHDKDRHLDLKKHYTGKNDNWASFFDNTLKNDSDFDKILRKELKTEHLQQSIIGAKIGFKLSRRLIKCMKTALDAYAKHTVRRANFTVLLDYMKSFTYRGQTVIQIRPSQANVAVPGFSFDLRKMIDQEQLVANKSGSIGKERIRIKTNLNPQDAKVFAANKEIELSFKGDGNKAGKMIKEALDSSNFKAFLAGLELVNAVVSFKKLYGSPDNLKNQVGFAGSLANLTSTSTAYIQARMIQKGVEKESIAIVRLGNISKISGLVGSGVSVAMCVWDSVESYRSRDYDASLAWGFTAIVSGILFTHSVGVVFGIGALTLGFWPVLVLSVLFFGGMFLAIYFTDSPLEKYLNNSVLSSDKKLAAGSLRPYKYIENVYNDRDRLVSGKFSTWRDFVQASKDLYDLLISYRVEENVEKWYSDLDDDRERSIGEHIKDAIQLGFGAKIKKTKKLKIQVQLRKFIYDKSSFDFALKLFVDGVKSPSNQDITLLADKTNISTNDESTDTLEVIYDIPEHLIKKIDLGSEFIFISRTIINQDLNEYWPHQNGTERYMAYRFYASDRIEVPSSTMTSDGYGMGSSVNGIIAGRIVDIFDEILGTNIRVGTENEVFNGNNWSK